MSVGNASASQAALATAAASVAASGSTTPPANGVAYQVPAYPGTPGAGEGTGGDAALASSLLLTFVAMGIGALI